MANCLSISELQSLISGSGDDKKLVQMTDHVGACVQCQKSLESVASGEFEIESLVSQDEQFDPRKESAYWKVVQNVQAEAKTTHSPDVTADSWPSIAPPSLTFLQPSDDPAYLGRLDHFEIARIIGRGGMGLVLEAFDTHLQRQVAIKVLNPEYAKNEIARQRFCREARAAAAISHEHVVSMYQVGKETERQLAYLVMQLIDGETLEKRLSSGVPFSGSETARVGMQIASGLAAAHARGMVHRDIKPANVLIERESNRVKLTDFGLARATEDVKLTKTGMVSGTPLYMSPEQAMGATADERSDLFSFGAVMYEMATGKSPFEAPSIIGVMKRVMDEQPVPPRVMNPDIPRQLSDLIMGLLEKKPEDRPESAAAVANVLAGIYSELAPVSPLQIPAMATFDVKKLSGKHKTVSPKVKVTSIGLITMALIGIGVALGIWLTNGKSVTLDEFPSVVLAGNQGAVWSVDFVPNKNEVIAAVDNGTVRLWDIPEKKVLKSFKAHRGVIWNVKFHPTRSLVATSGDDFMTKLWDGETLELVREWKATNSVKGLAFSPDGKHIASGDKDGQLRVYDIDTGEEVQKMSFTANINGLDYSPNGSWLAVVFNDSAIRILDAKTLEERQTLVGHDGAIYNVHFAPNSELLATAGWGKAIHIWDIQTGQEFKKLATTGDVWGVSFCQDSTHVVTANQDGTTKIWDISTGKAVRTLGGHESTVHSVTLDHGSHRIVTSGRDGTIRIWDLSSLCKK